jgi:cell division initiation protein
LRITPLDIYQQEFKRILRGFDPDEVEDFLERVADDYEQVIKENVALRKQIESLEARLTMNGEMEQVDDSEAAAGEEASNIIRQAKKEADNVIREARKEADSIIRKAKDEAREVRPEAGEIPNEVSRRKADLLLEEARKKANELVEKAKIEDLELRRDISRLRGQKERFLIEYRELLEKHLKFLTGDA